MKFYSGRRFYFNTKKFSLISICFLSSGFPSPNITFYRVQDITDFSNLNKTILWFKKIFRNNFSQPFFLWTVRFYAFLAQEMSRIVLGSYLAKPFPLASLPHLLGQVQSTRSLGQLWLDLDQSFWPLMPWSYPSICRNQDTSSSILDSCFQSNIAQTSLFH